MYKKKCGRRLCAVLLAAGMLLGGCGGSSEAENKPSIEEKGKAQEGSPGTAAGVGRYMEEELDLGEDFKPDTMYISAGELHLLSSSALAQENYQRTEYLLPKDKDTFEPVDWTERVSPELKDIISEGYLSDLRASSADSWLFTSLVYTADSYEMNYYFMERDGQVQKLEEWEDASFLSYWYGGDGYFYIVPYDRNDNASNLYRMKEEGGAAEYITEVPEGSINSLFVCGDYIFLTASGKNLYIYSLEKGMLLEEDTVLTQAVEGSLERNALLIAPAETENSIYVVTNQGLYHHVMYGNVMEQVIDGSVCSLGDVSRQFTDICVMEEQGMPVFYLLYSDGRLMRHQYDAEALSVPDTALRIFSMEEDRNVRLAVGAFRTKHPELYVQYDVGMMQDSGQSREDVLKNLATQLAAGEGPDVFVLDGIPYASYVEKGVLSELTAVRETIDEKGGIWEQLADDYAVDGEIYGLPMCFKIPVIAGESADIASVDSLEALADKLESLKGSGAGSKLGLPDAGLVLNFMGQLACGEWMKEDGTLDKEALSTFLGVCKRIYQAEIADMTPEEAAADYADRLESKYNSTDGQRSGYEDFNAINNVTVSGIQRGDPYAVGILGGNIRSNLSFFLGGLHALEWDYRLIGDTAVCLPQSLLGINRSTAVKEVAEEFVSFALSQDFQVNSTLTGIPMNKGAFQEQKTVQRPEDKENFGVLSVVGGDGEEYTLIISWPEEEELAEYVKMVESLDTVSLCDSRLYDAVVQRGVDALTGEKGIEETVDAVAKEVSLYLAE